MSAPRRLRLLRRRGFDLQAQSRSINGLPAVGVARPGVWGNPFVVTEKVRTGCYVGGALRYIAVPNAEEAVATFAEMMATETEPGTRAYELRKRLPELRGKNLACWCRLDEPCHADVLLRLANAPACDDPEAAQ